MSGTVQGRSGQGEIEGQGIKKAGTDYCPAGRKMHSMLMNFLLCLGKGSTVQIVRNI